MSTIAADSILAFGPLEVFMTVSTASKLLGAICITACLALGCVWFYALDRLTIGGPIYARIIDTKDIVADVLPPPLYIIEPYLDATLALNDPTVASIKLARSKDLQDLHQQRQDYWLKASIDTAVAASLTVDSYEPANKFWRVLRQEFYPALIGGEPERARQAYATLSRHYADHRAAIDRTVELANANGRRVEADASETQSLIGIVTISASLLVLGLILLSIAAVILHISKPMRLLSETMGQLATGQLDLEVPEADRKDELGDMARSVIVFRDAVRRTLELERLAEQARAQTEADRIRRLEDEKQMERRAAEERDLISREGKTALEAAVIRERQIVNDSVGASLARLAEGDLTCDLQDEIPAAYSKLKQDFNTAVERLRWAIADVSIAVGRLARERKKLVRQRRHSHDVWSSKPRLWRRRRQRCNSSPDHFKRQLPPWIKQISSST